MRRWPATRAADRDPAAPALCASRAAAPRASSGDSSPWRGRACRVPPLVQAALSPGTNTSSPGIVIFLCVLLVDFAMTSCLAELSSPAGGVSAVAFGNTRGSHGVSHSLPGPMCLARLRPKATHPPRSLACVSAWGPRGPNPGVARLWTDHSRSLESVLSSTPSVPERQSRSGCPGLRVCCG